MRVFALACAAVLLVAGVVAARTVHPFLAVHRPVEARYLVVEGWLPDYAIEAAYREFQEGGYERIFTTGLPLERGSYLHAHGSYPAVAAATLVALGLPTNHVVAVTAPLRHRNRTYASAVALREYCASNRIDLDALNLVSLGAHARRSGLCFRRALGPGVRLGTIAIRDEGYEPDRWWAYSSGVKSVGGEILALAYAWIALDYGD